MRADDFFELCYGLGYDESFEVDDMELVISFACLRPLINSYVCDGVSLLDLSWDSTCWGFIFRKEQCGLCERDLGRVSLGVRELLVER